MNHVGNTYLSNNNIATGLRNHTPSINDNYLWIPETIDNVVPGLDPMLTYNQNKYATLTALQNAVTNTNKYSNCNL